MSNDAAFQRKLKKLREARKWSHAELGRAAGLSTEGVRLMELGRTKPTWRSLEGLARAFDTTVGKLVEG